MFTVTCKQPAELTLFQRAPHHDQSNTIAVVVYLSRTWQGRAASGGGTGIFREKSSRYSRFNPEDCEEMLATRGPANVSTFCVGSLLDKCFRLLTGGTNAGLQSALEQIVAAGDVPRTRQEQLHVCTERVGMSSMMREPGEAPKYMGATDELFELVYAVPYVWNRAVIYDGAMLHAAHIDQGSTTEALSCDPSKGRLAASIFLEREEA